MSETNSTPEPHREAAPSVSEVVDTESLKTPTAKRIATVFAALVIAACGFFLGYAIRGDSSQPVVPWPEIPPMSFPGSAPGN